MSSEVPLEHRTRIIDTTCRGRLGHEVAADVLLHLPFGETCR